MKRILFSSFVLMLITPLLFAGENVTVSLSMDQLDPLEKSQIMNAGDACLNSFIHNDFSALAAQVKMNEEELEIARIGFDNFQSMKKEFGAFVSLNMFELKIIKVTGEIADRSVLKTVSLHKGEQIPVTLVCLNYPRQALALYEVSFKNAKVVFTLLFFKENNNWVLKLLDYQLATYKGKGYKHYRDLARGFHQEQKILLCFLFYQMAADLLDFSRYYRFEDTYQELGQEAAFLADENICYNKQIQWNVAPAHDITVFMQRYFLLLGERYIHIFYIAEDIEDESKLLEESKRIYSYMMEHYPDAQKYFNGIFVSAYLSIPKDPEEPSATLKIDWNGKVEVVSKEN